MSCGVFGAVAGGEADCGVAGGTLAKIVYFEQNESSDHRKRPRSLSHDLAVGEMTQILEQNEIFGKTGVQDVRLRVHSKHLGGVSVCSLPFGQIPVGTDDGPLVLPLYPVREQQDARGYRLYRQHGAESVGAQASLHWRRRSQGLHWHCGLDSIHRLETNICEPWRYRMQYAPLFAEMAAIDLEKYDEMDCTILGLNLLLTTMSDEVYTFEVGSVLLDKLLTWYSWGSDQRCDVAAWVYQDVDASSFAASRMKTIKYDVNENIYPYLVRCLPVCCIQARSVLNSSPPSPCR